MPGKWFAALYEIAVGRHGYVTTADMVDLGGRAQVLVDMERHGHLDRVSHGVYRFRLFPVSPHGDLMAATLWPNENGAISHDSALDLWDLCDVNPSGIHITVPASARLRRRVPSGYVVYERDLDESDLDYVDGVRVVTARRAILDGIERHLDRRLIGQAITNARRRGLLLSHELGAVKAALT